MTPHMLTLFGLPLGTLSQIGTFGAVLVLLAGAITVFIKGMPERMRAANEARKIESDDDQLIRTDYAQQIAGFRDEVHGYRNEVHAVSLSLAATEKRLSKSETVSRLRSDRINNMMFIIRLLISELKRLDPHSIIVQQAEAMLGQMAASDLDLEGKSAVVNAAEHSVAAAETALTEVVIAEGRK